MWFIILVFVIIFVDLMCYLFLWKKVKNLEDKLRVEIRNLDVVIAGLKGSFAGLEERTKIDIKSDKSLLDKWYKGISIGFFSNSMGLQDKSVSLKKAVELILEKFNLELVETKSKEEEIVLKKKGAKK